MEHKFKVTNIKGKDYVQIHERVKYFRTSADYKGWSSMTEILSITAETVLIKATICNAEGMVISTGHASEDRASSMINKTNYIENGETSAIGRALGFLGIGIDTSIASSHEIESAMRKQEVLATKQPTTTSAKQPNPPTYLEDLDDRKKAALAKFQELKTDFKILDASIKMQAMADEKFKGHKRQFQSLEEFIAESDIAFIGAVYNSLSK